MAELSADTVVHAALTGLVVDRVTLKSAAGGRVKILNRDASTPIYYRLDGVDPVVGGSESFVVPAGQSDTFSPTQAPVEVRLVSALAAAYTVSVMQ